MHRADPDDGSGNRVSGAHWDAGQSRAEQGNGTRALGAEATKGFELGDLLSHGMDNPPASEIRARSNRGVCRQDNRPAKATPVRKHVGFAHKPGGIKSNGYDTHGFLCIVAAVAETIGRGGEKLQLAKPFVHDLRRLVLKNTMGGNHKGQVKHYADDRSNHDGDKG